jgi:hypothetical protein
MNERIRELAVEAGYKDLPTVRLAFQGFDKEKFAELIVRECVEHLESSVLVPNIEHSRTKTKCVRAIKEHFGVEE